MPKVEINIVKELVYNGRAKDLLALMDGESKYSTNLTENIPKSKDELYNFRMAWEHVRFIAKFGLGVNEATEGSHFYNAYPEFFEKWLNDGCLGINQNDLMAYLAENPL